MSENRKTIAIIGAGIVGVSTAIWLQREGHDVILIEREAQAGEGTSFGNGGVLASCSVVPVTVPGLIRKAPKMLFSPNQPLFLKWGYLPRLAPWLLKYLRHGNETDVRRIAAAVKGVVGDSLNDHLALAEGTGAEKWIVPSDYLFLYRDRAHYDGDAFGFRIRRDLGFSWDELEGQALRDYDPTYSDAVGFAARFGDHGRITDPGQYVKDLAKHAVSQGARMVRATVTDFARDNGQITGVRTETETIPCDGAVLATGAWSKVLGEKLGLKVPLESERGYHLELWEPNVMPRAPVMVASGKFVMTPMDGRLRLAGIVEFGGLDAPASKAPFALLKRQLKEVLPQLTWKEETEWMGHRPAPADSIPAIGEVPGIKGAWLGFGHHHIGLTGGPKTGKLLAQMIAGKTPNVDVEAYSPSRFTT
ncbi:NAD(P)/FAD-dependent oxidoreductase [Marimonas arenosa]|uniref:FAD-dependent oxidoreductase n=1 Tax=Marimonas arenosa TaxID=1795305 RepID=A0AAE3WBI0_9RHOB|nr:FAD-dependent oxidoreductase [Marimonas arenosa]MDQ2090166.1 FAD-dependent oxidoreductase [Marimonas arenosa]